MHIEIQALQFDGKTWTRVNGSPDFPDMAQARAWLNKRNRNHVNRHKYQFVKIAD